MKSCLRTLLLWIMALALPAQGIAASTMLFCGTSHARMMQGAAPDHHAHAASHGHDHTAPSMTPVHHLPAPAEAVSHHGESAQDAAGSYAHLGQFSCSACAACCFMMALPASVVLPAQADAVHTVPAVLSVSVQSHLPDGPDRPPRYTSA